MKTKQTHFRNRQTGRFEKLKSEDQRLREFKDKAYTVALFIVIGMLILFVRENNIAKNKINFVPVVEASEVISYPEVNEEIIEVVETIPETHIGMTVECDLSFQSLKDADIYKNITVTPPEGFKSRISAYSCEDQKLLSRIGWYESEWKEESVNPENIYANGLFHILPTTVEFCANNGRTTLEDCAIYIARDWTSWFPSITAHMDSFKGLI